MYNFVHVRLEVCQYAWLKNKVDFLFHTLNGKMGPPFFFFFLLLFFCPFFENANLSEVFVCVYAHMGVSEGERENASLGEV